MSTAAVRVVVKGLVQGVGYRYFVYRTARHLGVTGWVRNRPDGTVEVLAEGDRGALEELIAQLKVGPPAADVRDLDIRWTTYTGEYREFDIGV